MLARLIQHYPARVALNLLGKAFAVGSFVLFAWIFYNTFTYLGMPGWLALPIAVIILVLNVDRDSKLYRMLVGWPRRPAGTDITPY